VLNVHNFNNSKVGYNIVILVMKYIIYCEIKTINST